MPFQLKKKKKKKFSKYANFQKSVAIKEANVSHEKAPTAEGCCICSYKHRDVDKVNSAKLYFPLPQHMQPQTWGSV